MSDFKPQEDFKKNLVKDTTNGKTEQEETCTNLYLLQVILSD